MASYTAGSIYPAHAEITQDDKISAEGFNFTSMKVDVADSATEDSVVEDSDVEDAVVEDSGVSPENKDDGDISDSPKRNAKFPIQIDKSLDFDSDLHADLAYAIEEVSQIRGKGRYHVTKNISARKSTVELIADAIVGKKREFSYPHLVQNFFKKGKTLCSS